MTVTGFLIYLLETNGVDISSISGSGTATRVPSEELPTTSALLLFQSDNKRKHVSLACSMNYSTIFTLTN